MLEVGGSGEETIAFIIIFVSVSKFNAFNIFNVNYLS